MLLEQIVRSINFQERQEFEAKFNNWTAACALEAKLFACEASALTPEPTALFMSDYFEHTD